jgi:hypothetical protein
MSTITIRKTRFTDYYLDAIANVIYGNHMNAHMYRPSEKMIEEVISSTRYPEDYKQVKIILFKQMRGY